MIWHRDPAKKGWKNRELRRQVERLEQLKAIDRATIDSLNRRLTSWRDSSIENAVLKRQVAALIEENERIGQLADATPEGQKRLTQKLAEHKERRRVAESRLARYDDAISNLRTSQAKWLDRLEDLQSE